MRGFDQLKKLVRDAKKIQRLEKQDIERIKQEQLKKIEDLRKPQQ